MKYLLTGVAAIAMLTACGDKDKPVKDPETGAEYAAEALPELKLRPGDPATAGQALAALSLDSPSAGRLSFGDSNVSGDKATFTNLTIADIDHDDDDDDDGEADMKVEKLEFSGLGMIDGQANFSRMLMTGISIVPTDPEEAEKGSATIKSIELVNPSPEVAAWVAAAFGEGEPGDLPKGEALSFDRWAMNDLNFNMNEDDEKGTFLISNIEVNGLQDQKAAQMLLKNMTFDMYDGSDDMTVKAKIGNVDIRGMDLKVFAPEDDEDLDADGLQSSFESGFMSGFRGQDPANPGYDSIEMEDVDVDVSGVNFVMDKLVSKVARDNQDRAVKVVTEPTTMKLNVGEGELANQLAPQLATLGYESLELTMAGEQTYDPDKDIITLAKGKNYWELKDGFRLDFAAKYEGASAMAQAMQDQDQSASFNPAAFDQMFEKLSIHSFEMALDDNGIVDRAFSAYAAQSGQDPEELRNQTAGLLAMAPMMAAGSGIDAELITEATTAMSSFITDPKTLTIKLSPAAPLKVSELAEMEDPSSLTKASLGFSAKNE